MKNLILKYWWVPVLLLALLEILSTWMLLSTSVFWANLIFILCIIASLAVLVSWVYLLKNRKRFTIYEGDWGDYYAARIEVWHKDAATGEETKLVSYPWSFISPSLTQPRRFMMKWKQRLRRAGAMK